MSSRKSTMTAAMIALASFSQFGCASTEESIVQAHAKGVARPTDWPARSATALDPETEARIDRLLAAMTIEDKVGQVIQADTNSITPEDLKTYKLGSVLSGGNSGPNGKAFGDVKEWLAYMDAFYAAAMDREGAIPPLFGIDAVHGHNNVIGATLFPHNIGLGAARDPELIGKIARVTAQQLAATGHDWTFAPTLATPQDDRWGRSYEGFSENPEIAASYASQIVLGLQGAQGQNGKLGDGAIVSSAKHFVGDGGTKGGVDQGDADISETQLRDIHAAGYFTALDSGVQTIMASFSSWQGVKHHGNKTLLTDVLKDRLTFDGFVVGDWNGHGQIPGCTNIDCPDALNAGLDMYMAPDSWRELYASTLAHAKSGKISQERLDDAVRRILRVKIRAGLFERGAPSSRTHAGDVKAVSSPEQRALAREAVRKSLVLLKNENAALPVRANARVLVVGDGADDIAMQSGGWTLNWQGTELSNDLFPNAQSIYAGLADAIRKGGGSISLNAKGDYRRKPDVAIFVFGEKPYAEFQGDLKDVDFPRRDRAMLARMSEMKAAGVKVVAVFLSGRPLWVNPEINAADAFVAAFLPGTEGGGIADVLIGDKRGAPRNDFAGKLSFSWPANASQATLNFGDPDYSPLFAYGYGLTYATPAAVPALSEESGLAEKVSANVESYFADGRAMDPFSLAIEEDGGATAMAAPGARTANGAVVAQTFDRDAQDDAWRVQWAGKGAVAVRTKSPVDVSRQVNGDMAMAIDVNVSMPPRGPVMLAMECGDNCAGAIDIAPQLSERAGWRRIAINLNCFAANGFSPATMTAPFVLSADEPLALEFSAISLIQDPTDELRCN